MNTPPRGRGLYVRDGDGTFSAGLESCQWLALHHAASRTPARAAMCRERGIPFWLWSGPGEPGKPGGWKVNYWRLEADQIEERAHAFGAQGIIADPEGGWAGEENEAELLGARLRAIKDGGLDVGLTSFPLWPMLGAMAAALDGAAWGSPQVYYLGTYNREGPGVVARWIDRWRAAGFGTIIPSVSAGIWSKDGFRPPDTLEAWRAYYSAVPDARAAIGWPISGPSGNVLAAWREYTPSLIPVEADRMVGTLERALGLPIEAIAGLLGSLAVLLVVGIWFLGR